MSELRQAAQAVVDRWDTPAWKDAPHTAQFIDRLRAALARSGQAASGSSQGARSDVQNGVGVGQSEAPTAAPPGSWDEYAMREADRLWNLPAMPKPQLIACVHCALIDAMRFAANPPARSVADPTGRTPTDYALEFAEYMAKAVELFLTVIGHEDARRLEMEEDAHDTAALMDAFDQAHTKRVDYAAGLRNDIYEFRKRRDRAIARSGAGSEEGQG